ncbi:hypothetical protein AM571_CH01413 [Rhizobium etli 8C-3]|uniref:Uncharacterized protein n=1 Tax=Rhizobium etli 8C-3 TaxID=538025 RepID=A0A1L5P285_RHIET|nr:hypothetical protein [Rhizobium etli]APO74248.1 hypothetical protein AM571_CH01413 [Rhizobium etli 8C-3]
MLAVDRFGFPPVVSKDELIAMAPHVRSECVALMRESGLSEEFIGRQFNVREHVIRHIADARHAFRLPKILLAGEIDEEDQPAATPSKKTTGLPKSAFAILKFMAGQGGRITASKATIARDLDMPLGSVDNGMMRLLDDDFVIREMAGVGGKPPVYCMTDKATAIAAVLFPMTSVE